MKKKPSCKCYIQERIEMLKLAQAMLTANPEKYEFDMNFTLWPKGQPKNTTPRKHL